MMFPARQSASSRGDTPRLSVRAQLAAALCITARCGGLFPFPSLRRGSTAGLRVAGLILERFSPANRARGAACAGFAPRLPLQVQP